MMVSDMQLDSQAWTNLFGKLEQNFFVISVFGIFQLILNFATWNTWG